MSFSEIDIIEVIKANWEGILFSCGSIVAGIKVLKNVATINKLKIEIAALRQLQKEKDQLIQIATIQDIEKYTKHPVLKDITKGYNNANNAHWIPVVLVSLAIKLALDYKYGPHTLFAAIILIGGAYMWIKNRRTEERNIEFIKVAELLIKTQVT